MMVLIKKSRYLLSFLKYRKKQFKWKLPGALKRRHCDLRYYKNRRGCLILGSHYKVPPHGPTPGSWVLPQSLGPTFPVCLMKQHFYDKNIMFERKKAITEKPW